MPTLTAAEKVDLRQLTGMEPTPYDIADTVVQTLYDRAYAYGFDVRTTEAVTVIFLLERLWGQARIKVDLIGELNIEKRSDYFNNLERMLKYWSSIAVTGGFAVSGMGRISTGVLNLGLDWTEDDTDAELLA